MYVSSHGHQGNLLQAINVPACELLNWFLGSMVVKYVVAEVVKCFYTQFVAAKNPSKQHQGTRNSTASSLKLSFAF